LTKMFSCIIAKHREFGLQLGWDIQPRHQPIENIRSRQLVSYPFILLSMLVVGYSLNKFYV
jgi:hypothetical protein